MSTLRATNIKNPDSGSNNIVLDGSGGVVISGVTTVTTLDATEITGVSGGMVVSGVTTVSAGSTSVPSISPSGDSNTGVFFPSADTISFSEGGSEAARIDSSGRLLVGTSTGQGSSLLQVEGTSASGTVGADVSLRRGSLPSVAGAGLGFIYFGDNSGNLGAVIGASADGSWTSGSNHRSFLSFSTTADGASSSTERMRITSSGYLKVSDNGAYSVASLPRHEINQSQDDVGFQVYSSNAAFASSVLFLLGSRNTTNGAWNFLQCRHNGVDRLLILDSGNVQNANNSYTATSDIKLKENVVDANSQWNDLKALRVRNYNFKEGQTHTQIGLIAQEVEPVSPGLVSEIADRDESGNDLGTVTKSVNYSVLYMKAVKALQEAMERIEQLETEMAGVKAQLQSS